MAPNVLASYLVGHLLALICRSIKNHNSTAVVVPSVFLLGTAPVINERQRGKREGQPHFNRNKAVAEDIVVPITSKRVIDTMIRGTKAKKAYALKTTILQLWSFPLFFYSVRHPSQTSASGGKLLVSFIMGANNDIVIIVI
ncbi:hypothetical protein [uncultured Croceitalea sp.]|uniref:hypothetical protein n=1 Tax=uncultured Croceitalea sp. TaxID=1798908 RepID=UPI003305D501